VDLKQDDVAAAFRDIYNKWGGVTYAMTWDGDLNLFYYNGWPLRISSTR